MHYKLVSKSISNNFDKCKYGYLAWYVQLGKTCCYKFEDVILMQNCTLKFFQRYILFVLFSIWKPYQCLVKVNRRIQLLQVMASAQHHEETSET